MNRLALTFAAAACIPAFLSFGRAFAASRPVDYAREVRPLLSRKCFACHGPSQKQAGLRLDFRADALRGGDTGPALRPGKSGESLLVRYISGADPKKVMPPTGPRLTPAEVALLRRWIDEGAAWDGGTASGDTEKRHWAFVAPKLPAVPRVKSPAWVSNPIDAFVLARLEREGLRPSPPADRSTLIRRLSLDLTGLPPSPEEVEAFERDTTPSAYEKVVDRLLASPYYGERWGRHWLDLARYADSDGYEKDQPRPYAYLYRDWVIAAFNADMPFDRFTIEQMAGDLLPNPTLEQKIATGFHRNTLKNKEGGADQEEDRNKIAVDRVNTTATAWLGLTMACAECHSHKYDPFSQREYYGLFAFFNSVSDVDIPVSAAEQQAYEKALTEHRRVENEIKGQVEAAEGAAKTDLEAKLAAHRKKVPPPPAKRAQTVAENPKPPVTRIHLRGDFLRKGDPVDPHTPSVLPAVQVENARPTRLDLARWLVDGRNPLTARVAVNRVWQHLFGQGLVRTPDDWGTRGERPSHPELLDWLASAFSASPADGENEGKSEEGPISPSRRLSVSPSPRLAWSNKQLIKVIVMSSAYQQSSRNRPELVERDPRNVLLARQSRFRPEAETVRDLYLAASGLLNREVGGPSIRPPLPADIAALGYAGSIRWPESKGAERYKRGMYIFFQRTVPYPMLATFDAPDSNATCTRRERSNTPLQALTLLNDPVFFESAQALARRVLRDSQGAPAERARHLFRICLAREPSASELGRLNALHREMAALVAPDAAGALKIAGLQDLPGDATAAETAAWVLVARTVLNLDEFVTRE